MMKFSTFAFLFFALVITGCFSCSKDNIQKNRDLMKLNDSAVSLLQKGQLEGDTTMVRKAILILDSVLSIDTIKSDRYRLHYIKVMAYNLIGDSIGADKEQESAIRLLPYNHIDRLMYYGEKFQKKNLEDSASYYFSHAIQQCDNQLTEKYDANIVVKKVQILLLQKGKEQALDYLNRMQRKYPHEEIFHDLMMELKSDSFNKP